MELKLTRKVYTTSSTIGELSINGKFECYILEDPVRPEKIKRETAIPAGTYDIVINHSDKFGVQMPLLEDVPNYAGIRIHPGSSPADTWGCLLPGTNHGVDSISGSQEAYSSLFAKLSKAQNKGEPIAIRIVEGGVSPFMPGARPAPTLAGAAFRVTGDPLNLRSSAADKKAANLIAPLPYGSLVHATGKPPSGNWTHVIAALPDRNLEGWCHSSYLEPLTPQSAPKATARKTRARNVASSRSKESATAEPALAFRVVNTDSLNLRSKPADLAPTTLIASLPAGHRVTRIADSAKPGWMAVRTILHDQTLEGFVHSGFLAPEITLPPSSSSTTLQIPEKALQMILDFEGMDQPSKWPGSSSGISLGHGYDLGYYSRDEFETDWGPHLTPDQMKRLVRAIGKTGTAARDIAGNYTDIRITVAMADEVFRRSTVPKIKRMTTSAFPGVLRLPPDAQGGLASLVYNRGGSMEGDRRREMREIRDTIADPASSNPRKVQQIADSILSMKRLWPDVPGLRRRRDAEAKMVRKSA